MSAGEAETKYISTLLLLLLLPLLLLLRLFYADILSEAKNPCICLCRCPFLIGVIRANRR